MTVRTYTPNGWAAGRISMGQVFEGNNLINETLAAFNNGNSSTSYTDALDSFFTYFGIGRSTETRDAVLSATALSTGKVPDLVKSTLSAGGHNPVLLVYSNDFSTNTTSDSNVDVNNVTQFINLGLQAGAFQKAISSNSASDPLAHGTILFNPDGIGTQVQNYIYNGYSINSDPLLASGPANPNAIFVKDYQSTRENWWDPVEKKSLDTPVTVTVNVAKTVIDFKTLLSNAVDAIWALKDKPEYASSVYFPTIKPSVESSGIAFSNDITDYTAAQAWMIKQFAPQCSLSTVLNLWMLNSSGDFKAPNFDSGAAAQSAVGALTDLGFNKAAPFLDFIAFDKYERDDASPQATSSSSYAYDFNEVAWNRALEFENKLVEKLMPADKQAIMLWQIPASSLPSATIDPKTGTLSDFNMLQQSGLLFREYQSDPASAATLSTSLSITDPLNFLLTGSYHVENVTNPWGLDDVLVTVTSANQTAFTLSMAESWKTTDVLRFTPGFVMKSDVPHIGISQSYFFGDKQLSGTAAGGNILPEAANIAVSETDPSKFLVTGTTYGKILTGPNSAWSPEKGLIDVTTGNTDLLLSKVFAILWGGGDTAAPVSYRDTQWPGLSMGFSSQDAFDAAFNPVPGQSKQTAVLSIMDSIKQYQDLFKTGTALLKGTAQVDTMNLSGSASEYSVQVQGGPAPVAPSLEAGGASAPQPPANALLSGSAGASDPLVLKIIDSVADRDGIIQLSSVERLHFKDKTIAFDFGQDVGKVVGLYESAFNRTGDLGGIGYYLKKIEGHVSLTSLAREFLSSKEYAEASGPSSNTKFVETLYQNAFDRSADAPGLTYWTNQLNNGVGRAEVLASFAGSAEMEQVLSTALHNSGVSFVPWQA